MAENPAPPPFAAVIVAAGKGLRVGGETPKQFRPWRGKPLLRHSVERLLGHGAITVCVAIAEGTQNVAEVALKGLDDVVYVTGGATRQQSVRNALDAIEPEAPETVLIHDAARPDVPAEVTRRLVAAIQDYSGAIPVLPVVDSLAVADDGLMAGSADRNTLKRVQTPQAFCFADIHAAHRAWQGEADAGDDAQVLREYGGEVALVDGDERLRKITFAEDFMTATPAAFRIGQGFDVHRLVEGEELWLCGVQIPHDKGLSGHSDADVAIHALVDAMLGAIGNGDIGTHFPPSDPQWKGAPSPLFLEHAVKLIEEAGYAVGNIDLTVICEAPRIGPHRDAMRAKLAELLCVEISQVSIKATTTERLGFTGRGEGIAAQAIVSLQGL